MKRTIKRMGIIMMVLLAVIGVASLIAAVISVAAAGYISGHWFIGVEMTLMAIALSAYFISKKDEVKEKVMALLESAVDAM